MMRMMMEIVMVIAIVLGMVFVMKITSEENKADKALPEDRDVNESADHDK